MRIDRLIAPGGITSATAHLIAPAPILLAARPFAQSSEVPPRLKLLQSQCLSWLQNQALRCRSAGLQGGHESFGCAVVGQDKTVREPAAMKTVMDRHSDLGAKLPGKAGRLFGVHHDLFAHDAEAVHC